MTELSDMYGRCVTALGGLARGLTPEQLAVQVPATPEWTVHQVLAHLAGGASDAVSGRMDGAPGSAWTWRQVNERARRSPDELITELESHADAVAATAVDNPRPAFVWDIAVHLADVHEALGLGRTRDDLWMPVLAGVAPYKLGGVPVAVQAGSQTWGSGDASVETTPYELFRVLFSRRSRAQMHRWGSPALSDSLLDDLPVFGPRDDDQPIPV